MTDLARIIDHTLLRPDAVRDDIERLCDQAAEYGFAAVCVNPCWVAPCTRRLGDGPVKVCVVVGFPLGAHLSEIKALEARRAVEQGAREVDVVAHLGALKMGNDRVVEDDLRAVVGAAGSRAMIKVILETGLLERDEIVMGARLAEKAGAAFVKTSTGFAAGATPEAVALLRATVGMRLGVKASGGIRTRGQALAMIRAGASRIGTSAGVQIMSEAVRATEADA